MLCFFTTSTRNEDPPGTGRVDGVSYVDLFSGVGEWEMTEFQQATLLVGWVQAGVALFVGMVQSGLFFYGINRMSDASERRARQTDRQIDAMMKQIEVMADAFAKQHEESMNRTDALTRLQEESMKRTEIMAESMARQHEESMRRTDILADTISKQLEESTKRTEVLLKQSEITMKQSETAMLALRRLLERTAD